MNDAYIKAMMDAIREMHGCASRYVRTERVKETFKARTVWEGDVEIFDIQAHPEARQCYAWRYTDDDGRLQYVAVLGVPPVDSALRAVQVYILNQEKT